MNIVVSRRVILASITGGTRKYCTECKVFFDPLPLQQDPHATHYSWFLPLKASDFELWLDKIQKRDEGIWGYILDEHGTRSQLFCPPEFTITLID